MQSYQSHVILPLAPATWYELIDSLIMIDTLIIIIINMALIILCIHAHLCMRVLCVSRYILYLIPFGARYLGIQ